MYVYIDFIWITGSGDSVVWTELSLWLFITLLSFWCLVFCIWHICYIRLSFSSFWQDFYLYLSSSVLVISRFIIFIRPSFDGRIMVWRCPSVRPSVRRCVRPSVRSVVHNSCGQDIARPNWPRMLKLVCTLHMERERTLFIFKVKGQISKSLGLYKEFWHLDPCVQDIARTILSGLLVLMYAYFYLTGFVFISF